MKKIVIGLALISSVVPFLAFASVDCQADPSACTSNGNPGLIMNYWGLTGDETPKVPAGATITDERGLTMVCPWFYTSGCYDLTHTAWYRHAMGYSQ